MSRLYVPSSRLSLRGPSLHERRNAVPEATNTHQGLWFDRFDKTRTIVTVSGSQTVTYPTAPSRELVVTNISGQSANDFNCVLVPETISTGQTWRCEASVYTTSSAGHFVMAALVLTDGTSSTSNVVSSMHYKNITDSTSWGGWNGTLTNVSVGTGDAAAFGASDSHQFAFHVLEVTYSAANTFSAALYTRMGNGTTSILTSGTISKTMTPTHVGFAWSIWGDAPSAVSVRSRPVYRYA